MKTKENNITTLDEILDNKYGKRGAKKREQWEQEFHRKLLEKLKDGRGNPRPPRR